MNNQIDFYFDIISPYSYIAHKKIQKISTNNKIQFDYKPILLGGLHNLAEIVPPAFNKYKMKNMKNDCELISKKNNLDFAWNVKFPINSIEELDLFKVAIEIEKSSGIIITASADPFLICIFAFEIVWISLIEKGIICNESLYELK